MRVDSSSPTALDISIAEYVVGAVPSMFDPGTYDEPVDPTFAAVTGFYIGLATAWIVLTANSGSSSTR